MNGATMVWIVRGSSNEPTEVKLAHAVSEGENFHLSKSDAFNSICQREEKAAQHHEFCAGECRARAEKAARMAQDARAEEAKRLEMSS